MLDPMLNVETVGLSFFNFLQSYSLMAVPLFIFAGFLMERTGMVRQLFQFAEALVSWIKGGFGLATVTTCVMFSAISGSSVAVASAIRSISSSRNAEKKISGLVICRHSCIGRRHWITDTAQFIADHLWCCNGDIYSTALHGRRYTRTTACAWDVYNNNYPTSRVPSLVRGKFDVSILVASTVAAIPGLGMPVLVLGGLYGGLLRRRAVRYALRLRLSLRLHLQTR